MRKKKLITTTRIVDVIIIHVLIKSIFKNWKDLKKGFLGKPPMTIVNNSNIN